MKDVQKMVNLLLYLASYGHSMEDRKSLEELAVALVDHGAAIPTRCGKCALHSSTRQPYDNRNVYCSRLRRAVPADHYCKLGYCTYPHI